MTAAAPVNTGADLGLYTLSDAGRLARIPRRTVARWAELGAEAKPLYSHPGVARLLTFEDLISLFVVRALRKAHVELPVIKSAERRLAQLWGVDSPFAHGSFKTRYGVIVTSLTEGERPVAVGAAIQEILYELIEHDLKDVSYDAAQRASAWRPVAFVLLRPDVQFGQPCIAGTRVTTRTAYQFVAGGEPVDEIAADLAVTVEQLEAAYRFEESLAKRLN